MRQVFEERATVFFFGGKMLSAAILATPSHFR